jgi:putative redox protein
MSLEEESSVDVARVKLTGRRQFVGTDGKGHSVVMDASPEFKGEGSGFRPVELVLHALGACTAMDVVSVLEKKRMDVRGVEVVVSGAQREDDYPHYYETITLEYVVTGFGVEPAAVQRAIELSEEKYCSVKGMFGPQVSVDWTFRVQEAPGPANLERAEP